ncbi:MAG: polysaccharide biosynthesis tyrosine autokinase [Flavobacteriales bacterium]|nr:polysaccharide biosynthesis tyrosine autokinase [Flavobacteriales bacterium]
MYQDATSGVDNANAYQEKVSNLSQDFDLGVFLSILKRHFKWMVLFFILAATGAKLYLRYTPLLFEASAVLQMTSQNTAQKVLNVENIYEQDVAGEIELVRSRAFIANALSRINLDISYFSKGKILDSEMHTASPFNVEVRNINGAIIGTPIHISFPTTQTIFTSYTVGNVVYNKPLKFGTWISLEHLDVKVEFKDFAQVSSQSHESDQNPYFFVVNNVASEIDRYYHQLDVSILNQAAKTIQVTVRENNASKAADIVNAIASEFIEYDVEKKSQSATKVLEFIDEQLVQVYDKLSFTENKMQHFKKENKLTKQGDIITVYVERLDNIENELVDLEMESSMLEDIETMIASTDEIDVYSLLPALTGSSFQDEISTLVQSLHQLLARKEEILYTATPESEGVKAVDYQIKIQQKLLLGSIRALINKFNTKKVALKSKVKDIEDKFYNLPTQELEYARLLRLFTINEKFYTNLLEKKAEYSISKAGFVSKNVILQMAATPSSPISPNRKKVLILFVAMAFIFSGLLIVVSYLMHNEITSVQELTRGGRGSILGIVPTYKKDIPVSQLLVDKNPKSLIAEAFRSIRTNLQFINNDPGPKVIAITSTVSGEGKTFVTINLSGIIAFSEKKVIVIDLDLRKPKIHLGFNFENVKGISTLLSGKDTLEECVNKTNIPNLDVITAGPIPPNPSELIISQKMEELIAVLKETYDVIVIDNPPVGIVTDGISMIQKADYPIYVFRANVSKKNYIGNVDRLITESKIKSLAVVLNGVDTDNGDGLNYGYGYGYTYGYGYYDEESDLKRKPTWKRIFGLT